MLQLVLLQNKVASKQHSAEMAMVVDALKQLQQSSMGTLKVGVHPCVESPEYGGTWLARWLAAWLDAWLRCQPRSGCLPG